MIFFFSGTGNSEYAARKIAEKTGDAVVSIGKCVKDGKKDFYISEEEFVGFVFPVYAWDAPKIVIDFVREMRLTNYRGQYAYAVFTCGASAGVVCGILKKALAGKGVALKFARDLVMPDNYIIMFNPPEPDRQEVLLAAADAEIDKIAGEINKKAQSLRMIHKSPPGLASRVLSVFFNTFSMGTRKFHASGACRSCGLCEEICPVRAIAVVEGRPRWRGGACAKCMGCISRCPATAIQYGESTIDRPRYIHPIYRRNR